MLKTNSILSNKSPETPKIYKYYRGDNNINNLKNPKERHCYTVEHCLPLPFTTQTIPLNRVLIQS